MKNFNEYVHFVVGAKIAGCEIEEFYKGGEVKTKWFLTKYPKWNWWHYIYRIKLPEGWEYVIEDGDIAFREVKDHEYYCDSGGHPRSKKSYWTSKKYPIIKRKDNK
jgi:hypothetical protein